MPDAFDVALGEVSGIRFAAVSDELDRRIVAGAGHLAVEIHRNGYQRANASRLHHLHQFLAVIADGGVDIGGAGHGMDKIQRLFALLFQQHAHPQLAGVEVNPVAKDKQQQQGDDHRNQPAAGVADNLPRLFHAQGAHAPPR